MRNISISIHKRDKISVTLSAGTGGTAVFTTSALGPVYTLSSLPIGTQIQLVQIQGVDTYVFLYNGSEIGSLTITASSGYNFDSVSVNSTTVTSTAITLNNGDVINVAFSLAEILLAHCPNYGGYEMVRDGVDSIGFKFQNVGIYDSSISDYKYYSGEIWMSDTDYGMPTLNQMNLYPDIVLSDGGKSIMAQNGGENLYIPGNLTAQNTYQNSSWSGSVDLTIYDGTPSQAWTNAHFVNTLEWEIISAITRNVNLWETPDGLNLYTDMVGAQIPGTYVNNHPYSELSYTPNTGHSLASGYFLGYIPGDYYNKTDGASYRVSCIQGLPYFALQTTSMQLSTSNINKTVDLGKMRVLNTTKTSYSLDS